ncbi:MAG: hypothetical protein JNL28_01150 [Planctomycetes bacterium]|nr:hypothetical protein [Planctomycetota bacterium]
MLPNLCMAAVTLAIQSLGLPILEPVPLTAPPNSARLGPAVAVSGDTVVVGSYSEPSACAGVNCIPSTVGTLLSSGAAYVFVRQGNGWALQAYLKASNPGQDDIFGSAIAISGDTLVIGAEREASAATGINGNQLDNSAPQAGAAYVFVRVGGTWSQQAYLKASNTLTFTNFGRAVAISGDTIVIGAHMERSNATGVNGNQLDTSMLQSGAAYVFERTGSVWAQTAYLKASNTNAGDNFGDSVAVDADTIVVGARLEDSAATGVNGNGADNSLTDSGAAYVFKRQGSVWSGPDYLKPSNPSDTSYFGDEVGISRDSIVIGSPFHPGAGGGFAGAAYVFVRSTGTWSEQGYLTPAISDGYDRFGHSVSITGDRVLVGTPFPGGTASGIDGIPISGAARFSGAAYEFNRVGQSWVQMHYIKSTSNQTNGRFGSHVRTAEDTGVVLAVGEEAATYAGAVHVIDFDTRTSAFCSGDGTATACPCGNVGLAGHGCATSLSAGGAELRGAGVARLSFDSLQLVASGLGGGAGIFIQGSSTQAGGAGLPFGDGLLCVAGGITRLAIQFPTGGSARYPAQALVDVPLSVLGAVSAGTTRFYQFWHRDNAPFCTPSTFNLTNGLTVPWGI